MTVFDHLLTSPAVPATVALVNAVMLAGLYALLTGQGRAAGRSRQALADRLEDVMDRLTLASAHTQTAADTAQRTERMVEVAAGLTAAGHVEGAHLIPATAVVVVPSGPKSSPAGGSGGAGGRGGEGGAGGAGGSAAK